MTKDEVLDLALEELENCADLLKVFEAPIDSCVGATMLQAEATITAIKQALAAQPAPVQEPVVVPENWFSGMPEEYRKEAWRVATPPAAPVQPDYKQLYEQVCEQYDVLAKELEATKQALAAQPAPVQPVGKVIASVPHLRSISVELLPEVPVPPEDSLIYTTPPTQPAVQEPVENRWRTLALQFDAHRMSALAHLRAMVQDPAKHAEVAREFLSAPPPASQPAVQEPVDGTQVSKVWWDGEKLMAKPIPLVDFYQPVQDSTCNETLRAQDKAYPRTCKKCGKGPCIGAPKQPPSQPAPVPLTDDQIRGLTPKPDGVAEVNVRRAEVLPGVMGAEFDEVDAWSMPLVLQIARAIEAAHGITEKGQP